MCLPLSQPSQRSNSDSLSPRRHSEQNTFVVDFSHAMIFLSNKFIHTASWLAVWQDRTASCQAFSSAVSSSGTFGSSFFNGRRPTIKQIHLAKLFNYNFKSLPGPGGFTVSLNGGFRNFLSKIASTFMMQWMAFCKGWTDVVSPPTDRISKTNRQPK